MARSTFERGRTSGSVCGLEDEINTESSHARRRSNFIKQAPSDPSKRPMITLDGRGFVDTNVSRTITTIFKNMFNGSWTTWKEVNKSDRDELWVYFKKCFQWEVVTDVLVREVWEDTIKNRYPNIMLMARNELIKMARLAEIHFDGHDVSVLKPYNPKWIKSSYWEDMIDRVWNTAEWKTKSKSRRVNQLILKEASNHCASSSNIAQHKRKLEKKLRTSLTLTSCEPFELTHTQKGTGMGLHEFMKIKEELVWAAYKEAVVAKYGPSPYEHPIFDLDLWESCSKEVTEGGVFV